MDRDLKQRAYGELVATRKECSVCSGDLENASRIGGGFLDSERIGPYTQWQGNLDSPIVLVAQDFGDVRRFRKYRGWAGSDVQTNLNLVELVREAGFKIAPPKYREPNDLLFFTNAVLCMKISDHRGRQEDVPARCYVNCVPFLRRTIEIVEPRAVVTLGRAALETVCHAYQLHLHSELSELVGRYLPLNRTVVLVPMYHPSPTVVNTSRRGWNQMRFDWRRIRPLFEPVDSK